MPFSIGFSCFFQNRPSKTFWVPEVPAYVEKCDFGTLFRFPWDHNPPAGHHFLEKGCSKVRPFRHKRCGKRFCAHDPRSHFYLFWMDVETNFADLKPTFMFFFYVYKFLHDMFDEMYMIRSKPIFLRKSEQANKPTSEHANKAKFL